MPIKLDTFLITSIAYSTMHKDGRLIKCVYNKDLNYVKQQSEKFQDSARDEIERSKSGARSITRYSSTSRKAEPIWKNYESYNDTSSNYQRPYLHMGLRSRISRNSCGSIPKQIDFLSREQIQSSDSDTIKSFLTDSRSIRNCCLAVFAASSKMAGRCIGFFKGCSQRAYRCKPIVLSVEELSKNTHAGTDTLGKKNNLDVQKRVIRQVRDIFRKPSSHNIISKHPIVNIDSRLFNLFGLPELIFHRFQAIYDETLDICKEKSRIVWCVPYTIVALENIFFGELINSVKKYSLLSNEVVYPLGLTNYQIGQRSVGTLRNRFHSLGKKDYKIYSLDFSKYDSTIPNWAKDLFFSLCRQVLDLDKNQSQVYDYLRVYVKHTPFVFGDEVKFKKKGISSGLLITNVFDTWWNLTIHYFVHLLYDVYPECIDDIYDREITFDKLYMDKSKVKYELLINNPIVRVMGDDTIILCSPFELELHKKICTLLGMKVTVKHVTHDPFDPIFFLGRYWNYNNRPYQSEEYMSLRIVYTKYYNEEKIPFSKKDIHLNRMLSICLPLIGGKEFLDKYLFDYKPYQRFKTSKKGFIYIKEFIEDNFRFVDYSKAFDVDNY